MLDDLKMNAYRDISGTDFIPFNINDYYTVYSKSIYSVDGRWLYTILIVFLSDDPDDYYFCIEVLGNLLHCYENINEITLIEKHAAWVYKVLSDKEDD